MLWLVLCQTVQLLVRRLNIRGSEDRLQESLCSLGWSSITERSPRLPPAAAAAAVLGSFSFSSSSYGMIMMNAELKAVAPIYQFCVEMCADLSAGVHNLPPKAIPRMD